MEGASILGVWGLYRAGGLGVSPGTCVGGTLESLDWERHLCSRLWRAAQVWLDLGPGHQDPEWSRQGCGCPLEVDGFPHVSASCGHPVGVRG